MYTLGFVILSVTGSLLSASSENWFCLWVGMEISTLSFLAIMVSMQGILSLISAWKYLVYQSVGSMLMLYTLIQSSGDNLSHVVGVVGVGVKIGLVPFHSWVFHIVESSNVLILFMLFSIQKIAPLIAVFNMLDFWGSELQIVFLISAVWSSLLSMGKVTIKQVIALSSILMSSWMGFSLYSWVVGVSFFVIYVIHLLFFMVSIGDFSYQSKFSSLFLPEGNIPSQFWKMVSLGALIGLPPFGVFMMKMEVIRMLIESGSSLTIFTISVSSGVMLFGYMKFIVPIFLSGVGGKGTNPLISFLLPSILVIPLLMLIWV